MKQVNARINLADDGDVSNLNLLEGEKNHIMVVVTVNRVRLFVNGAFVDILYFFVTDLPPGGDVAVITGAYDGTEIAGSSTPYEGFRGYDLRLRFELTSGTIEIPSNGIGRHGSRVYSRDFVAEALFTNPLGGSWAHGFIFRNPTSEHLDIVSINSRGRWVHITRWGFDEHNELGSGWLSDWNESPGHGNRLVLIAMGETGWLFSGDTLEATLDLSQNMESGEISALAAVAGGSSQNVDIKYFLVRGAP